MPTTTADPHKTIEQALLRCLGKKYKEPANRRSGATLNLLHDAVVQAYAMVWQELNTASTTFCPSFKSESGGKIEIPYSEGVKHVDAAVLDEQGRFIDAFFIKAPTSNYAQNRVNYGENMMGTAYCVHQRTPYTRLTFIDFLPEKLPYFNANNELQRWQDVRPAALQHTPGIRQAHQCIVQYEVHPSLQNARTRSQIKLIWRHLERHGERPIVRVDTEALMAHMRHLVEDTPLVLDDIERFCGQSNGFSNGMTEYLVRYIDAVKDANPIQRAFAVGALFAQWGQWGAREQAWANKVCTWLEQQAMVPLLEQDMKSVAGV